MSQFGLWCDGVNVEGKKRVMYDDAHECNQYFRYEFINGSNERSWMKILQRDSNLAIITAAVRSMLGALAAVWLRHDWI